MAGAFPWMEIRHVAGAAGNLSAVLEARISGPEWVLAMTTISISGALLFMVVRAISRRIEGAPPRPAVPASDVITRLERIEAGVEAIALEVERISENQRFVTQLMSKREEPRAIGPVRE